MINNNKDILKKWLVGICVFNLLSVMLTSCVKDSAADTANPSTALVSFIQASPGQPPLDVYFDNTKVSQSPINYADIIDYFSVYAGQRSVNVYNTGTKTTVVSGTISINANNAYSVFMANKVGSAEFVLLNDTLAKPASGTASVRFVNVSPDVSPVDLVEQSGQVLVTNKAYKGYSSFIPVPGNTPYTFNVVKTGTSTILATLSNVKLNANYDYTIWLYGLETPLNNSEILNLGLITNAYFN